MDESASLNNGIGRALVAAAIALLLQACSEQPVETVVSTETATQYDTSLSMAELMSLILEPAADHLWRNGGWILDEDGYRELYPTTDAAWAAMQVQAAIIIEHGNSLALPGRAYDNDAWMIYSEGLSQAGLRALNAAAVQDEEEFFQAGAQLYSVCTACHQAYNPDILNRFDSNSAD